MDGLVLVVLAMMVVSRFMSLRKFWRLPKRQGETWFFSTEVGSDFYGGAGATIVRRYRAWLVAPLAADAIAIGALALAGLVDYALHEQLASFVVSAVFYHLLTIHFGQRVRALAEPSTPAPPTAVYLSLEPRRLRDHTNRVVEAGIAAMTIAVFAVLFTSAEVETHMAIVVTIWVLYLQAGLLLLKQLFVRAKMKLPARRTEDYTRWRSAWLLYHMRVFDALRLWCGLTLLAAVWWRAGEPGTAVAIAVWALGAVVLATYGGRERRRLAVVEREVEPATLAREFPPTPIPDGRFLAGGLFFVNRDNPSTLVRGPVGVAVNLANVTTYLWVAYLVGFVVLVAEQALV